eukprot:3356104-Prymnesium_polylepis.1
MKAVGWKGNKQAKCAICGKKVSTCCVKCAEFLRRRPEIVAKRFSTLPSDFVEPYSEGTVTPQ